jgi:hypothetical protein
MATFFDVANKAKDSGFFRQLAAQLQQLDNSDWTEWEWEWLGEMAKKSESYVHSEREREKLAQIYSYSQQFSGYDGLTVVDMARACYRYHLDFAEEDGEFIVDLCQKQAQTVRKRQLRRLVRLYADSGDTVTIAWPNDRSIQEAV